MTGPTWQTWQHCGVAHAHNPHPWSHGGTDTTKSCPGSSMPVYVSTPAALPVLHCAGCRCAEAAGGVS